MADIACRRVVSVLICGPTTNSILTRGFLLAVTSEGAHYCVLLSTNAISSPLDVAFGLGGLVLGLALGVLLLARLGPGVGAGQVADGLDGGALEGVELASGLATRRRPSATGRDVEEQEGERGREDSAHLGSPLLEDMVMKELCGV